jgi:predicted nucleic acid-binding protein
MELSFDSSSILFIDTAPFIYYFEDHPVFAPRVDECLSRLAAADGSIVTSYISYIELITQPTRLGRDDLVAKYRRFFTNSDTLTIHPMNFLVAEKVAEIRVRYTMKTPDAIQIATAIVAGADYILTNDNGWKRVEEIPVVTLD